MKAKTNLIVLIILMVIGLCLFFWGYDIMINYEDYREIWKAARHEASPQLIGSLVVLIAAYCVTFIKSK